MSSIKSNHLTKEIELKGSESFIESNFNKIQKLMVESIGVQKRMISRSTKAIQESKSVVIRNESLPGVQTAKYDRSEASPIIPAAESPIHEISLTSRVNRPPQRKYFRKVGIPGHERVVVQVAEQKQGEISLASLREKFGLSESKIGGIIRDAEKLGKVRKAMNGSYVWSQE